MDITIKTATKDDIADIAAIHVSGWQGAYGRIIDQAYIDSHTIESRKILWAERLEKLPDNQGEMLIAHDNKKPVGFVVYGSLRTAPAGTSKIRPLYSSEIYGLYLIPEVYRQKIGTQLVKKAVENLKMMKHHSMCLWVLDKNKRACGFYEAIGGQRVGKKMVEFGPNKLKEVCYGWRDISVITDL